VGFPPPLTQPYKLRPHLERASLLPLPACPSRMAAFPTYRHVLLGLRIDDPDTEKLAVSLSSTTLAVMTISFLASIIALCTVSMPAPDLFQGILLPLIGVWALSSRSRCLLYTYAALSGLCAFLFVAGSALTFLMLGDPILCMCTAACAAQFDLLPSSAVCSDLGRARALFWLQWSFSCIISALEVAGCILAVQLSSQAAFFVQAPELVPLVSPSGQGPVQEVAYPPHAGQQLQLQQQQQHPSAPSGPHPQPSDYTYAAASMTYAQQRDVSSSG
jgi:hypothetical protein